MEKYNGEKAERFKINDGLIKPSIKSLCERIGKTSFTVKKMRENGASYEQIKKHGITDIIDTSDLNRLNDINESDIKKSLQIRKEIKRRLENE